MHCVTVKFSLRAGDEAAFLARVRRQAADSLREEPGCHVFEVWQTPGAVFLYEVYEDAAAFEAHLASPHFRAFDEEVAPMVADKRIGRWEPAAQAAGGDTDGA